MLTPVKKKPKDTAVAPLDSPRYTTQSREQKPTDAPPAAALKITEILEQILTYLSPQQIFSLQRVSRTWKSVIAGSPAIQEKLLLRFRDKPKETWQLLGLSRNTNDVRLEKTSSSTQPEELYWTSLGSKFSSVTINPFLRATRWKSPSCVNLGYTIPAKSILLDMYVSDPPCDTAWILATFYPSRSGSRIYPGNGSRITIPNWLLCVYRLRSTKKTDHTACDCETR
jgi:hypothetical protein